MPAQAFQQGRQGAQQGTRMRTSGRAPGRVVSDQEHARASRELGQTPGFDVLLKRATEVGRGQYLGVEPDISSGIYRFKFMRPSGNVVWVDIDGRTGRELAVRE